MHAPRETTAAVLGRGGVAPGDWALAEGTVPESRAHDLTVDLVRQLLAHWARTALPRAQVGKNLAVRWDEANPAIGVDPDVYVVDPAPPEGDDLTSLRLWEPGHHAPLVGVEVVSPSHPTKDYRIAPAKYAASGTRELWTFDPLLCGPRHDGGPYRIQLWAREDDGSFVRRYAGEGPVLSPAVGGWLVAVERGARLRIASDAGGAQLWPTAEEAERAAKEAERAAKEVALARVLELEAMLRSRG